MLCVSISFLKRWIWCWTFVYLWESDSKLEVSVNKKKKEDKYTHTFYFNEEHACVLIYHRQWIRPHFYTRTSQTWQIKSALFPNGTHTQTHSSTHAGLGSLSLMVEQWTHLLIFSIKREGTRVSFVWLNRHIFGISVGVGWSSWSAPVG